MNYKVLANTIKIKQVISKKIILIAIVALFTVNVWGQTLYIPNGTSGIDESTTGNIGIGTDTPARELEVTGTGNVYVRITAPTATDWSALELTNTNETWQIINDDILTSSLRFHSVTSVVDAMTIKSTGEVGIGTTTPRYPLEVKNTKGASSIISSSRNTAGNLIAFTYEDATNDGKFYLIRDGETTNYTVLSANGNSYFNGGNVGIGTDTPARELEVTGTGNVYARITAPTATDWSALELTNTNETWQIINDDILTNSLRFHSVTGVADAMTIKSTGNVGIGTIITPYKLSVEGTIGAREVIVTSDVWADFVFEPTYNLMPLKELDTYIQENKHLPEIPTTAEVKENGISVGEMNAKLLQKIEELTLYVIEQEKKSDIQNERIGQLENIIKELHNNK